MKTIISFLFVLVIVAGTSVSQATENKELASHFDYQHYMPPTDPEIAEAAIVAEYGAYDPNSSCGGWAQTTPGSGTWQQSCYMCTPPGVCFTCVDTVIIVNGSARRVQRQCFYPA